MGSVDVISDELFSFCFEATKVANKQVFDWNLKVAEIFVLFKVALVRKTFEAF